MATLRQNLGVLGAPVRDHDPPIAFVEASSHFCSSTAVAIRLQKCRALGARSGFLHSLHWTDSSLLYAQLYRQPLPPVWIPALRLQSNRSSTNPRVAVFAARGFGSSSQKAPGSKGSKKAVCPCGGGAERRGYQDCCRRFHAGGGAVQPDAESLMRARYTAFAKGLSAYIVETTHPDNPDMQDGAEALQRHVEHTCGQCEFRGLEVRSLEEGSHAGEAFVTFRVTYGYKGMVDDGDSYLDEKSRFVRENDRWLYREQIVIDPRAHREWQSGAGFIATAVKGARTYSTSKSRPTLRPGKSPR